MTQRFAGLDLLRFIAASLVMLFHFGATPSAPQTLVARIVGGRIIYPELLWLRCGWVGVQIFFVISGIVIAYSATTTSSPTAFLRSRVLRLYPAAWLVAPLSAAVLVLYSIEPLTKIGHAFINSMFLVPYAPWVDDVYWTLGIEMAFYGTVYLLLVVSSPKRIVALCWIIGGTSAAYWFAGSLIKPSWTFTHLWDRRLDLVLIHHGIYFALGILLYRGCTKGWSWPKLIFAGALLAAATIQIDYINRSADELFGIHQSAVVPVTVFLLGVGVAVAALCWQAKSSRLLYLAGLATYPLYLLHRISRRGCSTASRSTIWRGSLCHLRNGNCRLPPHKLCYRVCRTSAAPASRGGTRQIGTSDK